MIFTDEDLKRFHSEYDEMGSDKIDALLARLEAMEALWSYVKLYVPISTRDEQEYNALVKVYLKAAGK